MTTERRKPWYQLAPYPAVVGVLLDHELLTEGGTDSLKLAARIVEAAPPVVEGPVGDRPYHRQQAIMEKLDGEHLATAESLVARLAANDILIVLGDHEAGS